MEPIRSFRDLLVWQKGILLVKEIYRATGEFPREEVYGLTSQLRRAAVSIPSNIAEGYGRRATVDYIRFLKIASGSLYESQTQLEIAKELGFLEKEPHTRLNAMTEELERMLNALIAKLETRANTK